MEDQETLVCMSEEAEVLLDSEAFSSTPPHLKIGSTPSFLEAGATRTVFEMAPPVFTNDRLAWQKKGGKLMGLPSIRSNTSLGTA